MRISVIFKCNLNPENSKILARISKRLDCIEKAIKNIDSVQAVYNELKKELSEKEKYDYS